MVAFQHSVTVNKPLREVFAYLADFNNNTKWSPDIVEVAKTSPGPNGTGSTWKQVISARNRRMEYAITVDQFEADRKFHFKGVGGVLDFEVNVAFEPAAGGTKVTVSPKGQMKGLVGTLFRGKIEKNFQDALTSSLNNLKKVLESD